MKKITLKFKKILGIALVTSLLSQSLMPTLLAKDISPMLVAKKIEKIAVHKRIASELFEGNTLGIYPAEWSKKMSEEIDVAQLNTFLEMFNTKLSKIEGATVKQNTIIS